MKIHTNDKDYPIGHICDCKRLHEWPLYVFAHMNEELIHTCECGIQSIIINGTINKKEDIENGKKS